MIYQVYAKSSLQLIAWWDIYLPGISYGVHAGRRMHTSMHAPSVNCFIVYSHIHACTLCQLLYHVLA